MPTPIHLSFIMNKILLALGCFVLNYSLFAAITSPPAERGLAKELNVRSFYKLNENLIAVASIEIKDPSFDQQQRSYNLGSRYSLSENFKLSLFLGYVQNQKHNDNWVKENGLWHWNNENNKRDYNIAPEVSYRNLIRDLVYEFKMRYVLSRQFNEQNAFLKGNLIYNTSPLWTFILSNETKFSLSNNEKTFQENWSYFSPYYKLNNQIQMGPTFGYFKRFWTTSAIHKQLRTDAYLARDSAVSLGLNVNFYLN